MAVRSAEAVWEGDLQGGKGSMRFGSGAFDGQYSFTSRFEEGTGTNPEELIAAAHAGCFSMALSGALGRAGHTPAKIETTAKVTLGKVEDKFAITKSDLICRAQVPGIEDAAFQQIAEDVRTGCIVSRALGGVEITLDAKLAG